MGDNLAQLSGTSVGASRSNDSAGCAAAFTYADFEHYRGIDWMSNSTAIYVGGTSVSFQKSTTCPIREWFLLAILVVLFQSPQAAWTQPQANQVEPEQIALRVIDPDGKAIAGAVVTIMLPGSWTKEDVLVGEFSQVAFIFLSGKTDAKGRFVVRRPKDAPSESPLFQVSKPGYVEVEKAERVSIYEVPPKQDSMEITLIPPLSVSGVVVNEQGQPIPDVEILRTDFTLEESEEGKEPRRHAHRRRTKGRTDEEGKWKFDDIATTFGACEIRLFHPEYVLQTEQILLSSVQERAPDSPVRTYVLKRGQSVTGRVTDERNRPIVGAQVRFKADSYDDVPRTTTTDEQGSYQLSGLTAGTYHAGIYAAEKALQQEQVEILRNTKAFDFSLRNGRKLNLQVVDEKGKPVANARVNLEWRKIGARRPLFDPPTNETDAEGRWHWNEAPEEDFVVHIYDSNRSTIRQIPRDTSDELLVIPLFQRVVMHGRVIDADTEQPIEHFQVDFEYRPEGDSAWSSRWPSTGRNGEFTSHPDWPPFLSEGRYRVEADDYKPAFSPSFRADIGVIEHEFRMVRQSTTPLRILNPDSQPVGNAQVVVVTPGNQARVVDGVARPRQQIPHPAREWPTTNTQGMADISLPDGDYEFLALHDRGFARWRSSQGPLPKQLTLTPWARLEGTFRLKDKPLAEVNIALVSDIREDHNEAWEYEGPLGYDGYTSPFVFLHEAQSDEQGKFRMERVYPGSGFIGLDSRFARDSPPKADVSHTIVLKPDESQRIDLGGFGRAVVGQLTWKDDESTKVNWDRIKISMSGKPRWYLARNLNQGAVKSLEIWVTVKPEPDGSFRIDDVPPGHYSLSVSIPSRPNSINDLQEKVAIPPDKSTPITERKPVNLGTLTLEPAKRP